MDISQSTQTFLLFFSIFLITLICLFFLFRRNKQVKLSLVNAVQTSILVVGFLTIIVFGGSYYFVLSDIQPSSQPLKDALSIAASFFGGFATLIAAYIASKLFNDWRDQKDHETKTIYLNNAIRVLSEINVSLINCRSNALNLRKIRSNLILMPQYINDLSKQHSDLLIVLYSNLKVVEEISNDLEFLKAYLVYDKYIYVFDNYNQILLSKYKTYYYYYIDEYTQNKSILKSSIFRPFSNPNQITKQDDPTFTINTIEVEKFFESKLVRMLGDKKYITTYDQHISDCIDIHESFFQLCIKALRAH